MKIKGEWFVFVEDDGSSHIVLRNPGGGNERIPTAEECSFAVKLLNEEGGTVIRLQCRNHECKDFGGWIERSRNDVAKNVYHCQLCGKAMER